jgi:DNA polymerase-3 subunit gamma/tau
MLYNKYRPIKFSEIVHQKKAVEHFRNSIIDGKIPNAIFLTGPTGTGKTTVARILAMAIHCNNLKDGEPCGECLYCKDILTGSYQFDTMVLDSSKLNIDDMRNIESYVSTTSIVSDKKVIIIEEFQELNNNPKAQKVVLPLLENCSENVHFILLAMDDTKINSAISSRQITYKFDPIPMKDLVNRLAWVSEQEGFPIEDPNKANVIMAIAENCYGSLRQAITWLEIVISTNTWDETKLVETLGIVSDNIARSAANCLLERDPAILNFPMGREIVDSAIKTLIVSLRKNLGAKINAWETKQCIKIKSNADAIHILEILSGINQYHFVTQDIVAMILIKILNEAVV